MPATEQEAKFITRLHSCIERCHKNLEHFRNQRKANIEAYVGPDYSKRGDQRARPVALAYSAITTFLPLIAAKNPEPDVTTRRKEYRPFAYTLELVQEYDWERLNLVDTIRMVLIDAMIGVGCSKTGICESADEAIGVLRETGTMDAGKSFFTRISTDNLIFDPDCTDFDNAWFIGDQYSLRADYVQESGMFENFERLGLNEHDNRKRARDLFGKPTDKPLYDIYPVYDVWLAAGNPIGGSQPVIITIPLEGKGSEILRVIEPTYKPYDILGFMPVPDNPLPIAPNTALAALDDLANTIARKLMRQAEREKSILAVERQFEKDAETIKDASDGDTVLVDNSDRLKMLQFGGADPQGYQFVQFLMALFSRQAGNVDMMGGLRQSSGTATEAGILFGQASTRLGDSKSEVYKWIKRVVKKLAGYQWTDPATEIMLSRTLTGLSYDIPIQYTPEYREIWGGSFDYYDFNIKPYSMEQEDPEKRIQNTMSLVERVILPTAGIAAQQGAVLNVPALVQTIGRELRVMEMDELYVAAQPSSAGIPAPSPAAADAAAYGRRPQITINAGTAQRGQIGPDVQQAQGFRRSGVANPAQPVGQMAGGVA